MRAGIPRLARKPVFTQLCCFATEPVKRTFCIVMVTVFNNWKYKPACSHVACWLVISRSTFTYHFRNFSDLSSALMHRNAVYTALRIAPLIRGIRMCLFIFARFAASILFNGYTSSHFIYFYRNHSTLVAPWLPDALLCTWNVTRLALLSSSCRPI